MDCSQFRQRILAGVSPGEEERMHAVGCPACAALLEDSGDTARSLAAFRDREPALPLSLDRLETALAEERGPRGRARRNRKILLRRIPYSCEQFLKDYVLY